MLNSHNNAVFIVDREANLVYAPPMALHLVENTGTQRQLEAQLREALRRTLARRAQTAYVFPFHSMVVHVAPLLCAQTEEPRYGVMMQSNDTGDRLAEARERFALTPREIDVIRQSLRGFDAHEIAEVLGIAPSTVRAYFKALLRKTEARNRSHLIAKIFTDDWEALPATPIAV